jgi:glutamine amidotransferase
VPFVAAVECGSLTATQFHPEKSGDAGLALLENWLQTVQ